MKEWLRRLFADTLEDLRVERTMRGIAPKLQAISHRPLLVIAFGKAARAMAQALVALLPATRMRGLVVPPEPDAAPLPPFEVIAGGHPLPSAGSLRAAARALELAQSAQPDETVVFLISGGGSALLELPGDPAVTLDELRTLYRALVACGADIHAINTVRRHLSAVKGGRLALAAAAAAFQLTLLIADVPSQHAADVASGPTVSDATTAADCRAVLDRYRLWECVPGALRLRLERGTLPPHPAPDHERFRRAEVCVIQDERYARDCLRRRLHARGALVVEDTRVDDWPHERAAGALLRHLDRLRRHHAGRPVAIVSSGELSVPLPENAGIGGRNQQFALACARWIRGRPITVLSGGTDGIDGNSSAAGGVVDGHTMARARAAGFDVHDHLARCDAFPVLHALGDTLVTGPTGTNVRDVRVLVHHG